MSQRELFTGELEMISLALYANILIGDFTRYDELMEEYEVVINDLKHLGE